MNNSNNRKEKELNDKLDNFLQDEKTCKDEECLINDPQELVQREAKKIITNDGRQLLSEYTV